MNEFKLINDYLRQQTIDRQDVILGIGDDAAIVDIAMDQQLVVATDTLAVDCHFELSWPAAAIGHRALAVNLSDLAAMAAKPCWATLNLSLSNEQNEAWLQSFCQGFFHLAQQYNVQLVGGDTIHGPCVITVTVYGHVVKNQALTRHGAMVGDYIVLSGELGLAGLALTALQQNKTVAEKAKQALFYPQPELALAEQIRDHAHAAIDISDGLFADVKHLLDASGVGGCLHFEALPIATVLAANHADPYHFAGNCGDDYRLCFTWPAAKASLLKKLMARYPLSIIGEVEAAPGLRYSEQGQVKPLPINGYQHRWYDKII